jgi:Ca2+-binding RTX toxin-like protein
VAAFAAGLAQGTGDQDVVLLGDLNAYSREDPIEELRSAGYTDLGEEFDPGRYSYVFDGLSGSLDHAMATAALTAKVTGVSHWDVNSVESSAYQYDGDPELYAADPYRSSDHDPLVVGIDLDERCQGLAPTITGTHGDDVLSGTDGPDVLMGLGGDDVLRGGNAEDVLCGGTGADTVAGDNGADVLLGGPGVDALDGGNGDDTLVGGPGEDALEEGRGSGTREQEGPES